MVKQSIELVNLGHDVGGVGGEIGGLRQVTLWCEVDLVVEHLDGGYGAVDAGQFLVLVRQVGAPSGPNDSGGFSMRAAVVRTFGGPEAVEIVDVDVPEPGPGQVRIKVAAAALNPVDAAMRSGWFGGPGGLGGDVAGTVDAAGADTAWSVGDEVVALANGTHAQYVVVDADWGVGIIAAASRHGPRKRRRRPGFGLPKPGSPLQLRVGANLSRPGERDRRPHWLSAAYRSSGVGKKPGRPPPGP